MRALRGRRPSGRGQGLVEFVLVLPILMLLLLMAIDFGRLFYSYVGLNNAARVAANYGSLSPSSFTGTPNTGTYDAMVTRETAGINCPLRADGAGFNPPIPQYPDPSGTGLGGRSVVSLTCDFDLWTPIIGDIFAGTVTLTAEAQFPVRTGAIPNLGGGGGVPVPGAPVAAFDFTGVSGGTIDGSGNVTGTSPVTVNVTDQSTGAQTYEWDWGDASPNEFVANPASHTFTGTGTFTVTLTVTNTAGWSTHSHTVTLGSSPSIPPAAAFYGTPVGVPPDAEGGGSAGDPIRGSRGLVVNFTNLSTGATAYSWNFGTGAPSTAVNPSFTYANLGIYSVVLTITDPTGGTPATRTSYVTIGCVAPTFANTSTSAAASTWSAAGFSGTIRYKAFGSNGNGNPNPPNPAKNIVAQEGAQGGQFYAPTLQGGQYRCSQDVTLVYQP